MCTDINYYRAVRCAGSLRSVEDITPGYHRRDQRCRVIFACECFAGQEMLTFTRRWILLYG